MFVKNFGEGYLEGYLVSSEMLPEAFRMFEIVTTRMMTNSASKKILILRRTKNPNLTQTLDPGSCILGGQPRISKYISNKLSQCAGGETKSQSKWVICFRSPMTHCLLPTWWLQPVFYGFRFDQIGLYFNHLQQIQQGSGSKENQKKWKFPHLE